MCGAGLIFKHVTFLRASACAVSIVAHGEASEEDILALVKALNAQV